MKNLTERPIIGTGSHLHVLIHDNQKESSKELAIRKWIFYMSELADNIGVLYEVTL
jgi:hypothetical protein